MAVDPKSLTIDYKELMNNTSMAERMAMARSDSGRKVLSALSPSEIAGAFPDYVKRGDSTISSLTSRSYGKDQDKEKSAGSGTKKNIVQGRGKGKEASQEPNIGTSTPRRGGSPSQQRQQQENTPLSNLEKTIGKKIQFPSDDEGKSDRQAIIDYVKKNVPNATDAGIAALLASQKAESSNKGVYALGDMRNGVNRSVGMFQMNNFGTKGNNLSRLGALELVMKEKTGLSDPVGYIRDVASGKIKEDPKMTALLREAQLEHFIFRDVDKKINNDRVIAALTNSDPTKAMDLMTGAIRPDAYIKRGLDGVRERIAYQNTELQRGIVRSDPTVSGGEVAKLPDGIDPEIQKQFDRMNPTQKRILAAEINSAISSDQFGGNINRFNQRFNENVQVAATQQQNTKTSTADDIELKFVDRTNEMPSGYAAKEKPQPYKYIGVHHTGGSTLQSAIETAKQKGVGYQYLIDRDGTVHTVQDSNVGRSNHWGKQNVHPDARNSNSVGISYVGSGTATPEQIAAGVKLIEQKRQEYNIPAENVLGHGEVVRGSHRQGNEGYPILNEFRKRNKVDNPDIAADPSSGGRQAWERQKKINAGQVVAEPVVPLKDRNIAGYGAPPPEPTTTPTPKEEQKKYKYQFTDGSMARRYMDANPDDAKKYGATYDTKTGILTTTDNEESFRSKVSEKAGVFGKTINESISVVPEKKAELKPPSPTNETATAVEPKKTEETKPQTASPSFEPEDLAAGGDVELDNPKEATAVPIPEVQDSGGKENIGIVDNGRVVATVSDKEKVDYQEQSGKLSVTPQHRVEPEQLREETKRNEENNRIARDVEPVRRAEAVQHNPPYTPNRDFVNGVAPTDHVINTSQARHFERAQNFAGTRHYNHGAANERGGI